MRKTAKGFFTPKNPQKYIGKGPIVYRSGWELQLFNILDSSMPECIFWGSETEKINYFNPTKGSRGEWTIYVPDILICLDDGKNNRRMELWEIKPLSQTPGYSRTSQRTGKLLPVSKYDQIEQIKNKAKWDAALLYCRKRGWIFRVLTEESIFATVGKK